MAFESISDKLNDVFKRLRGKGRLTKADVKEAMREVRLALLEADVSYKVVKEFTARVTERASGADVLEAPSRSSRSSTKNFARFSAGRIRRSTSLPGSRVW